MSYFVLVPSGRNACSETVTQPREFKPHRGDMVRFTMPHLTKLYYHCSANFIYKHATALPLLYDYEERNVRRGGMLVGKNKNLAFTKNKTLQMYDAGKK